MAGMAAEGRGIPIADRELTRGRRGTHSDRAHHHRRWFRAPARCRPEAGVPSRPCAFAQLGVRGFDRLSAVDAGRRPALRRPRACSRSTMRDLDARRAVRNPGLGVSLLRLRLCVTPRQGSAQRSYPGFPSHCRFQRAAVLQGSAVAGESQQSRRFSGTARHVLRATPRQRYWERCALASPRFTRIIVVLA